MVSETSYTCENPIIHTRNNDCTQYIQVVRYTALLSGIVYGFVHNRTLAKEAEHKKANALLKQKESWIEQAKKEYAAKNSNSTTSKLRDLASSATGGLIGSDSGEFGSLSISLFLSFLESLESNLAFHLCTASRLCPASMLEQQAR